MLFRSRVDGKIVALTENLKLDRQMRHTIDVVIDRLKAGVGRTRLAEAVEAGLRLGNGSVIVAVEEGREGAEALRLKGEEVKRSRGAAAQSRKGGNAGAESDTDLAAHSALHTPSSELATSDRLYSVRYACTHCGISYEPPSPQLFSFNSPQGMCPECDGLGVKYSFDPDLLVPFQKASFKEGCFELIGPWHDLGRWRRHIYQGVADTMERKLELKAGTLLDTPWQKLSAEHRQIWLYGTGKEHITYTWRAGSKPMMYGGRFEGIVPDLNNRYRGTKSKTHLAQLEKYMRMVECPSCHGQRLLPQARAVRIRNSEFRIQNSETLARSASEGNALTLPQVCNLAVSDEIGRAHV